LKVGEAGLLRLVFRRARAWYHRHMTRKERKLRKLVDKIVTWSWPDQHIEELIEVAHRIEGRRIAEAVNWAYAARACGMSPPHKPDNRVGCTQ